MSDFSKISLEGPVDLIVKQGYPQEVIVRAEAPMYSELEYKVQNNELEIGYENVRCFETDYGVTVLATIPDIDAIRISGSSMVTSDGELDLGRIDLDVSGEAEFMLEGEAETCDIDVSGSIEVYNFGFVNQRTDINISGSGEMEIFTEDELDVRVSGSAVIKYMGEPTIDKSVSGSLDLIHIN